MMLLALSMVPVIIAFPSFILYLYVCGEAVVAACVVVTGVVVVVLGLPLSLSISAFSASSSALALSLSVAYEP